MADGFRKCITRTNLQPCFWYFFSGPEGAEEKPSGSNHVAKFDDVPGREKIHHFFVAEFPQLDQRVFFVDLLKRNLFKKKLV